MAQQAGKASDIATERLPLCACVLTVSDSRGEAEDSSGAYLVEQLRAHGHQLHEKRIVPDDIYRIRAVVSAWVADPEVEVVLVNGGTGFSGRDSTPEAVGVLFDKEILGFGELFRHLSLADIGSSTIQSRATAGLANSTVIFCLPGSTGACRLAWEEILAEQLDSRHRPCNFAGVLRGAGH